MTHAPCHAGSSTVIISIASCQHWGRRDKGVIKVGKKGGKRKKGGGKDKKVKKKRREVFRLIGTMGLGSCHTGSGCWAQGPLPTWPPPTMPVMNRHRMSEFTGQGMGDNTPGGPPGRLEATNGMLSMLAQMFNAFNQQQNVPPAHVPLKFLEAFHQAWTCVT